MNYENKSHNAKYSGRLTVKRLLYFIILLL